MREFLWTWGFSKDEVSWYIRVQVLDTDMYALAYYSLDDNNPMRYYESKHPDLLRALIDNESSEAFIQCRENKNAALDLRKALDNATIANFM